jgi:hypothetical protein
MHRLPRKAELTVSDTTLLVFNGKAGQEYIMLTSDKAPEELTEEDWKGAASSDEDKPLRWTSASPALSATSTPA